MNILWLTLDHVTFRHYRLNKKAKPILPTYERLGRQGVTFDHCKSAHPLCMPARASMLTGVYTHKHGIFRNGPDMWLATEYAPAASVLKDAGYRLGYFGKNHSGMDLAAVGFEGYFPASYGNPYMTQEYKDYLKRKGLPDPIFHHEGGMSEKFEVGKDYNLVETNYFNHPNWGYFKEKGPFHEIDFLLDMAGDWLRERASENAPFVLRLDAWGPHQAYQIPLDYKDTIINAEDIEPYPGYDEDALPYKPAFAGNFLEWQRGRAGKGGKKCWKEWQLPLKRAYEHYSYIDMRLGSLLDDLERLGLAENTAVIFTADHGDAIASHGGMFDKCGDLAEELMDIPMVVSAPGLPKGVVNSSFVSNLDVVPTVLDLLGVKKPYEMDGISLKQVALGNLERDRLMCEHYGHHGVFYDQRVIYRGVWKYVETKDEMDQLYNLEADPYELRNEADSCPQVLAEMKKELAELKEVYTD